MKKHYLIKRIKKFFNKYINGARGAVSLLLVLTMSPLLSISLVLVESARYQDAIESMQEIIDVSSFSTLANYDNYLDERFGLLAVSQDSDINNSFNKYLEKNAESLGKSISLKTHSTKGEFPLSNSEILEEQILDYSELMAVLEALVTVADGTNLKEEIKKNLGKITKTLELDEVEKTIETVSAGSDLANEVSKLINAIKDTINDNKSYKKSLIDYEASYTEFETELLSLAEALADAEDDLAEDDPAEEIYNDSKVKKAIKATKKARNHYKEKAEKLSKDLTKVESSINKLFSSLSSIMPKLEKYKDVSRESSLAEDCTTSTGEWIVIIVDEINRQLKDVVCASYNDVVIDELEQLNNQILELNNYNDGTVKGHWKIENIEDKYGPVVISSININFVSKMDKLLVKLDEMAEVDDEAKQSVTNFLDIGNQLLGIDGAFDQSLNSLINENYLYSDIGMSNSSESFVASITGLITSAEEFKESISSKSIIKALKGLWEILKALGNFLKAVIEWAVETLYNLIVLIANPGDLYNNMMLYGYGAYNFPNRTTYEKGSTLTGYKYNKIFKMAGGKSFSNLEGSLKDLNSIVDDTGTDKMFKGAETEYLLVGSNSEIMNQSVVFLNLYLLRLVLDVVPILKNPELTSMTPPGVIGWIVKIVVILAEPMLDVIILVNGGKQYVVKETIYFSYSGFVILMNDITSITAFSKGLKDKMKDTIKAKNGTPKNKGYMKLDYTGHLQLLLLATNQTTYIERIKNLIQMECNVKYETEYPFNLDETYTYIETDVNYALNPMFKLDGFNDTSIFKANLNHYMGY